MRYVMVFIAACGGAGSFAVACLLFFGAHEKIAHPRAAAALLLAASWTCYYFALTPPTRRPENTNGA